MLAPDTHVKQFRILEALGQGGMGEVYLAEDTVLGRKVALKFLGEALQQDADARRRFVREAKSAAALDHPFICKVYETDEVDGKAYIAMEFVDGQELGELLGDDEVTLDDRLRIAGDVAEALSEAHKHGVIHRDLKPANIMITSQGYVKVMDFGLAKQVLGTSDDATLAVSQAWATQSGLIMGTVPYMSPEQARGDTLGPTSDVFSLGIILHELISGEHPFPGSTVAEVITSIMRDDPPPLSGARTGALDPEIERVVAKALSKDSAERYADAGALAADLGSLRKLMTSGPFEAQTGPTARKMLVWAPIAVGVLAIAVFAGWLLREGGGSSGPTAGTAAAEPLSVLIADFANTTGDSIFDDGALEMSLGIGLEGAPNVSLFARPRARQLAEQLDPGAGGALGAELAQLVSRSEGLNVIVDGAIESTEGGLAIRARAIDAVTGDVLVESARDIDGKAGVLQAADAIAAELRVRLSGLPPESAAALAAETFTTSSLEAMNAYARAQELGAAGESDEAIAQYRHAVEQDPEFGRAYAGLATVYYNLGNVDEATRYYELAMQNIGRMTDREKYRTRGGYYLLVRDYERASEEFGALTREYPADTAGPANLAFASFFARDMEEAVAAGKRAAGLSPDNLNVRFNLAWYALGAGDFELAESEARIVIDANPNIAEVYVVAGLANMGLGNTGESAADYDTMPGIGESGASLAALAHADVAIAQGRLSEAQEILVAGAAADAAGGAGFAEAVKHVVLGQVLLDLGNPGEAARSARQALELSGALSVRVPAALVLSRSGAADEALRIAGELGERLQPEPQAYGMILEGEVALARGDASAAARHLAQAKGLVDTWLGRVLLGRAYVEAGAFTEATSELENALRRRGEASSVYFDDLPTYRYFPQVHYWLGRAEDGLGADGTEAYEAFLAITSGDESSLARDARVRLP